ncbi:sugar phosphate isomerase/epimerase [Streptomyces sp. NBC_00620]|uniref:sugar phosphate isomerase/epimerase family protein n=1 Tax=unclassified Streptomyces TaxID=2593676 RepID=UPI0022525E88|nr:TIM barrel protein [Streptomyces sp. NBC_00620]MCX4977058.1 sugar phosphate isomerase/epimerase [Streptomyces sp. NBC_00620]WUC08882.1 sugar phosphate isomerase/epimerase [Streptomyces sp. NBC_00564]WUC54689.1 sugar phosphate isomerase/epimerase [Streptomyces sp. NBC_00554]
MTRELTASFVTLSGAGFAQPARVPFAERCRAAAAAGFTGIGLHTDDYRLMRVAGASDASMRAVLGTHGLALREIEFLSGWASAGTGGGDTAAAVGALARAFRPHHVTAGEFTGDELDIAAAGARLRTICDRVAAYGLRVAVEAFPWSGLKDVATARAVVEASGAPNAGLMIDVWHFYNTRSSLADLDGLPPDRIVAVQLNDGRVVDGDFLTEARQGRLLPGDGELDVQGLLLGLHERGFRGPYCIEVNYPGYRDLPVDEMAALAFTKASKALGVLPAS